MYVNCAIVILNNRRTQIISINTNMLLTAIQMSNASVESETYAVKRPVFIA